MSEFKIQYIETEKTELFETEKQAEEFRAKNGGRIYSNSNGSTTRNEYLTKVLENGLTDPALVISHPYMVAYTVKEEKPYNTHLVVVDKDSGKLINDCVCETEIIDCYISAYEQLCNGKVIVCEPTYEPCEKDKPKNNKKTFLP